MSEQNDMYSILIVDDEILAIRGVKSAIDWDKININRIFTAHNMKMACDVFKSNTVDIMLCDIEMPGGSGLDLLEWVHSNYPETVTVFLTCHADFRYAKEAVSLNAFDYLLKPTPFDELQKVLSSAVSKRRENLDVLKGIQYKDMLLKSKRVIEEKFWGSLLNGSLSGNSDYLIKKAYRHEIMIDPHDMFHIVLFKIDVVSEPMKSFEQNELIRMFSSVVCELLNFDGNTSAGQTPFPPDKFAVVIKNISSDTAELMTSCTNICSYFRDYIDCKVSYAISGKGPVDQLSCLYSSLEKCFQTDAQKYFNNFGVNHINSDHETKYATLIKNWEQMLLQGETVKLESNFSEFIDAKKDSVSSNDLKYICCFFMKTVYMSLLKNNIPPETVLNSETVKSSLKNAYSSVRNCKEFLLNLIRATDKYINKSKQSYNISNQICKYINENLHNELTREQISAKFFLNPDYIARLFKKEMNISISDYICSQRIERAKSLLRNTDDSISIVCEKVGYSYNSYFSKVFKRETGTTPLDYRRKYRSVS